MHDPHIVILDKAAIIKQFGLFSDLTSAQIELIAEKSDFYSYDRDEIIYNEGEPASALYCLVSGRVRVFTKDKYGSPTTLEYLHRGSYFGIISLLTGDNHSVTAQVVNDAMVLKIPKEGFDRVLREVPRLAIHFSSTLSRRLKRKDMGQKTVFESTIIAVYAPPSEPGGAGYAGDIAEALSRQTRKEVILLKTAGGEKEGFEFKDIFFDEARIKQGVTRHESGISVLRLSNGDKIKPGRAQVVSLLSYLTNLYDYCVIDLPNRRDEFVFTILAQSDLIHIITDNDIKNIGAAKNLADELHSGTRQPSERIMFILDEARGRPEQADITGFRVYATLPDRKRNEQGYRLAVRRIARQIGGVLVGLALGSGAALGLTQIGVIKVLEKEGIPIDMVAGSSVGALIGAFWAAGMTAADMERIALENKKRMAVFNFRDLIFPVRGLISDAKAMFFLKMYLGNRTFYDIKFPLKIVAAGLNDRREIVLESGELAAAVRASISIPGIYEPVKINGAYVIDGGVVNPVPVSVLLRMNVRKIIAVNTLPSQEDVERSLLIEKKRRQKETAEVLGRGALRRLAFGARDRLTRYFTPNVLDIIVNSIQAMEYSMAQTSCKQADVAIHPDLAGCSWRDFLNPEPFIALGEEACLRALPDIKKLVAEE
ncbi:MAG: patatin-like phospholipase family protein [Candidatus Omnitrophica bacterium]|nr:patatin-like phospholipase family protein [Candidatus Omnitrophota bacterium]